MSDFVDRLLGRSAPALIRPLLPTLFEPSSRGDVDEPLPLGTFTASPERAHDTEPAGAVGLLVPHPEPPAERATPNARQEQMAPAPERRPTEFPGVPRHQGPDPVRAPSPPVRHGARQTASEGRSRMDPEPTRRVAVPTSPPESSPGLPTEPPARRPAPPVVIERSSHRTSVFERNVVASHQRASEPDVHISIGRVEITAPAPPPTVSRRTDLRRRPQLTLDEYLKSREG